MSDRLDSLGGRLDLESLSGVGTTLNGRIPVQLGVLA
jgi:signal transduction histidine kinase